MIRTLKFALLLATLAVPGAGAAEEKAGSGLLSQPVLAEPAPLERLPDVTGKDGEPLGELEHACHCGRTCADGECDCDECPNFGPGMRNAWYFRVEYFGWQEIETANRWLMAQDTGAVVTVGLSRGDAFNRWRLEFFAPKLDHESYLFRDSGDANYIGGRVEYDRFVFPKLFKTWELLVGLGLRTWNREIVADDKTDQLWVSLYPYFGWESRRNAKFDVEWYGRGRIGVTAFTYETVSAPYRENFYPGPNILMLSELGIRGPRKFLSAYVEVFAWNDSPPSDNGREYRSANLTVGLQAGLLSR